MAGCASSGSGSDADAGSGEALRCGAAEAEVRFTTEDGVDLVADYRPGAEAGAPLAVLIHMIPPAWDRGSWPASFRSALADAGHAVLTLDRRGAGASGGEAEAAYEGPGGRLDVQAAVAWATDPARGCAVDPARIRLMAASNGTTSAVDYAAGAPAGLPVPDRMVMLSPGPYTENQTAVLEAERLARPILWIHPSNEDWAPGIAPRAPEPWRFEERGTVHGTRMLEGGALEAEVTTSVVGFLGE